MAPAATNESEKSPHFLAGGSNALPRQEKQQSLPPQPEGQGQRQAHVFLQCVDATMVDPTVISDAPTPTPPLCEAEDLFYGLRDLDRPEEGEGVKNSGTMTSRSAAPDYDYWFPVDLFTDELDYDLPAPEVVSHSSRADNSTIYSDELELDLFEEIPHTIDVPKRKKAKLSNECEDGHFLTQVHPSHSLLASWQPAAGEGMGGTVQFSIPASPFQALSPPPTMVTAPFGTATCLPMAPSPSVSKSKQINSLLLILCETIPCDPCQQVHDLMTLRLLLLRPHRTPEENHLLDTILILFESYMNAGRTRADIATMVVRDFSFHLQHQQQPQRQFAAPLTPAYAPRVSPVLQGQSSLGFLPAAGSTANGSPMSSISY
ncbi:hypothetical protein ACHAW6_003829 [Cyclotella cf. meneghiniana]